MSESAPPAYRVSYCERVRERLLDLADEARRRGDGPRFVAAFREFHRRLCVYPQFGDPLADLRGHAGQVRLGVVPPLAMRYVLLVTTSRWSDFTDQPRSTNVAASQSSSSGCVGGSPRTPKSLGVRTRPAPK